MQNKIVDELLNRIKEKGFFSEYLPESFNLKTEGFDIYGAGASHKDRIEPYAYYMSRFGKNGDRRMISVPEVSVYVALVNFLRDNKEILDDIIQLSGKDYNSFSRIVNEENEIMDDSIYGDVIKSLKITSEDDAKNEEDEVEHSLYVRNMIYKIQATRGASGILHIDISEFYRSIYTHTLSAIKLGIDGAKEAFLKDSQDETYKKYVMFDDRVRRLNGSRTNGILVGPFISRIISEAILARVDLELREKKFVFTRYADDYEIAIFEKDNIDDIKGTLITVFDRYGFRVNNEKTYYEKYPFYLFSNYEKIIRRMVGDEKTIDSVEIVELINKFMKLEKDGEKGAIRYLLKTYKNEYHVKDKQLYASYLLNILCNDEKALSLACKIIIHEYAAKRIEVDNNFYESIVDKLSYEIKEKHDLEVIWLTYLLKYTGYKMEHKLIEEILESKNEMAIIVVLEEWRDLLSVIDIEECWSHATSWILLYQIALNDERKRPEFFVRLGIKHNIDFYNKLFAKKFSFYKKRLT